MISRYTSHGSLRGTIGYNSAVVESQETEGESIVVTSKVGRTTSEMQEPKDGYCSGTLQKGKVCAQVELNVQEMTRAGRKFRSVKGKVANVDVSIFEKHQPDGRWLAEGQVGKSYLEAVFSEKDGKLGISGRIWPKQPTPIPISGNTPVPFELAGPDGSEQDFPFESVIPALLLVAPQ